MFFRGHDYKTVDLSELSLRSKLTVEHKLQFSFSFTCPSKLGAVPEICLSWPARSSRRRLRKLQVLLSELPSAERCCLWPDVRLAWQLRCGWQWAGSQVLRASTLGVPSASFAAGRTKAACSVPVRAQSAAACGLPLCTLLSDWTEGLACCWFCAAVSMVVATGATAAEVDSDPAGLV